MISEAFVVAEIMGVSLMLYVFLSGDSKLTSPRSGPGMGPSVKRLDLIPLLLRVLGLSRLKPSQMPAR